MVVLKATLEAISSVSIYRVRKTSGSWDSGLRNIHESILLISNVLPGPFTYD